MSEYAALDDSQEIKDPTSLLPDGWENLEIVKASTYDNGNGWACVNLQVKVTDGEHQGRIVFPEFTIKQGGDTISAEKPPTFVKKGMFDLNALRKACAIEQLTYWTDEGLQVLVGCTVRGRIGTQKAKKDSGRQDKNVVRAWEPVSGGGDASFSATF